MHASQAQDKKIAPEAQKTSWKRPDVCEQLASQKQDLDSDDRPGLIHHHNISMDTKKPLLDTYLIKNHLPISG